MTNAASLDTDAERVDEAVRNGSIDFLYNYAQRSDADKALKTKAEAAVKKYAALDASTGKYRSGKMDGRVRSVPKETQEAVFKTPEKTLPLVVEHLAGGAKTDKFLLAKILHDWICDNIAYDTDMYFSGRIVNQDYASVLKKKKAVCSGYSNLFKKMADLAGLEAVVIDGYSKGFGYKGTIGRDTDHAWNAAYIGSKWYLIDCTWDAGYVDIRAFIKNYSTEWLFLDSRPFLYSHLPEKDNYQFYAPIVSKEQFMKEPYIAGVFFQYGLSLKNEAPLYNNETDGEFSFEINQKAGVSLSNELYTTNQSNVKAASWSVRKGNVSTLYFDVPDSAAYKGNVFARNTAEIRLQNDFAISQFERQIIPSVAQLVSEKKITEKEAEFFRGAYFKVQENNKYYFAWDQFDVTRNNAVLKIHKALDFSTNYLANVLGFNLSAKRPYAGFGNGVLKYPNAYSTYKDAPNTSLIAPVTGVLRVGNEETFIIASKDYASFAIIINGEWNHFTKNAQTGDFELTMEIPAGIDTLEIYGGAGRTGRYSGLVQFEVK